MACLKLEVDDVEDKVFHLDPAVTVETEEQKDVKDPGSHFNTDCGYGDVITIAPLGDLPLKEESVGPNTECNESVGVDTADQDAFCQLNSAHDTDTQPVEPVRRTVRVFQRPPKTPNRRCTRESSSTKAEAIKEASHSQPSTSYRGTATRESSSVTDSSVTIPMLKKERLECSVRGKPFRRSGDLEHHVIVHKERTDGRSYRCQICGETFEHKSASRRHSLTHTGERPHICQICGGAFAEKRSLNRHSLTHIGEKLFECKVCGKGWKTPANLKQHSLTHTGEKPHECGICGKGFTHSSSLKMHSVTQHTDERPHKCNMCDKAYATQQNLKIHSLTHTGEKPFKCEFCGKGCNISSNLKQHLLTHTGEKPHKCHICGKAFARHSSLKIHSSTHTDEKPHKCQICGKVFKEKASLKRHSKEKHISGKSHGHRGVEVTPMKLHF